MNRATKRGFSYNDDDPEDDDFDNGAASPRKRTKLAPPPSKSRSKPPQKKKKTRYRGSDIEDDDDDEEEDDDSIESISDAGPSSPVILNPNTGKPSRTAARGNKSYAEPDSDDIPDPEPPRRKNKPVASGRGRSTRSRAPSEPSGTKPSLIYKFRIQSLDRKLREKNMERRTLRGRTDSGDPERPPSSALTTRRSSRISHDEEQPLVSLTDSGRHQRTVRAGSSEPPQRPSSRRRVQGGKGPVRTTSPIIEASQEDLLEETAGLPEEDDDLLMEPQDDAGDRPELVTDLGDDDLDSQTERKVIAESVQGDEDEEDASDVVQPRTRRSLRGSATDLAETRTFDTRTRLSSKPQRGQKGRRPTDPEEGSDFELDSNAEDDDPLSSEEEAPPKNTQGSEASSGARRSGRLHTRRAAQRAAVTSENTDDDELAAEAQDLRTASRKLRGRKRAISPDDTIAYEGGRSRAKRTKTGPPGGYAPFYNPDFWPKGVDDDQPATTSARNARGARAGGYRSLWDTQGPFGVAGGPPIAARAPGAVTRGGDSDTSDDESMPRAARGPGGVMGMTPTSATAPNTLFPPTVNDGQGAVGGQANLGKVNRKVNADADPLGVDQSVDFDGVGGLESHVNQLKEMVLLPLLYPELFSRLHVTPPRGVLFHGPPGTGKTLLARALSNSVTSAGKRVTFYMRKGADTLSKYVGEAERQLRLLFEDARKNQPSIIFFDEIDGLAPVRSSKQDQIHATIVTTLLALMDGMDGRGQVIVIGATNRPDTVDSALRRPGRFDREFYFPLPNMIARRAIIDIHTKGWEPALAPKFKDQLASLTNGYGGADLRALCTEAALNAIQGTYPQIYTSMEKLLVDPEKIKVLAKDFMISVGKIVPSSQRSVSSNASPLDSRVEPLLRESFAALTEKLDKMLPQPKKLTALEEAQYDDRDDGVGFDKELMQQNFDQARIFRPRMLVYGKPGMGQHFIGSALLHKLEHLHVQNFDLSVLYSDSTRSPQAAVVQLFTEARRHKPSVIYIPNIELWYRSLEPSVIELFKASLNSLDPNEPVLLLATMDLAKGEEELPKDLTGDLFGISKLSRHKLDRPGKSQRQEFFAKLIDLIRKEPSEFPDMANRKKRDLPQLEKAPAPVTPQKGLTKQQLKEMKKSDAMVLNKMKIRINPIMDQLKREYKGFRRPPVDPEIISYLFDAADPAKVASDVPDEQQDPAERPYTVSKDRKGVDVLLEVATGKIYYNIELVTVENRLSNGHYKRPSDFLADIKRMNKDAKTLGDHDKILKSNTMLSNVTVDIQYLFDEQDPGLKAECERVYQHEVERGRLVQEQVAKARRDGQDVPLLQSNIPPHVSTTTTETTGPILLGQQVPGRPPVPRGLLERFQSTPTSNGLSNGVGHSGSNGHAEPGHMSEDEIADSQNDSSLKPVRQASGLTQSQPLSQNRFMTPMFPGSQADQYHNSASTTTSGQKTSSKSKSSGQNTQSSNGIHPRSEQPNLDFDLSGGSQLPDTQGSSFNTIYSSTSGVSGFSGASGPEGDAPADENMTEFPTAPQYSQKSLTDAQSQQSPPFTQSQASPPRSQDQDGTSMRPPASRTGAISALLNNPTDASTTGATPKTSAAPAPTLILKPESLTLLHNYLVTETGGFTIEQLEQMNATLMDTLWAQRSEWNRNRVVIALQEAFNETAKDITDSQGPIGPRSQEN